MHHEIVVSSHETYRFAYEDEEFCVDVYPDCVMIKEIGSYDGWRKTSCRVTSPMRDNFKKKEIITAVIAYLVELGKLEERPKLVR